MAPLLSRADGVAAGFPGLRLKSEICLMSGLATDHDSDAAERRHPALRRNVLYAAEPIRKCITSFRI